MRDKAIADLSADTFRRITVEEAMSFGLHPQEGLAQRTPYLVRGLRGREGVHVLASSGGTAVMVVAMTPLFSRTAEPHPIVLVTGSALDVVFVVISPEGP